MQLHFENLLTSHLDELATVLLDPAVYQHIEDELPTLHEFKLGLERAIASPGVNYLVRETEFWATTTPANHRSQALLRRCGYVETGLPDFPLYSYEPGDIVFRRRCT